MGWETRQLASICQVFADGDWIESKDQSETGVRLIQTGNVGEGVFKDRAEKARYVSAETFQRLRCTEIFPGDCLISRLPEPVGRACIIPDTGEAMITAVDCTIVRFREGVYLPEFFAYYSQSVDYLTAVDAETTGTTRKRISRARLGQVAVPLPPVPEQRRIVAILDEAFEAIATAKANTEKNLRNAREWVEGQLSAVLDAASAKGRSCALETLVATSCTLSYGIVQPGDDVPGGLPVVRPVDLGGRSVSVEGLKRIDPALARSYARTTLEGGDLLLCVRGTTGTVSTAEPRLAGANVTRGIVPIRFDPQVITQALGYYLLRSVQVQAQIRAKTYGAALMQINIGDLRKIVVAFPPREMQAALVEQLDAIQEAADQLVESYERKLAALDELKKSLLHQAFTGQLTAKTTDRQLEAVA